MTKNSFLFEGTVIEKYYVLIIIIVRTKITRWPDISLENPKSSSLYWYQNKKFQNLTFFLIIGGQVNCPLYGHFLWHFTDVLLSAFFAFFGAFCFLHLPYAVAPGKGCRRKVLTPQKTFALPNAYLARGLWMAGQKTSHFNSFLIAGGWENGMINETFSLAPMFVVQWCV